MNRTNPFLIATLIVASCLSVRGESESKAVTPTPSAPLAAARRAIDKGNAQWIEAWDKADASLIAGLFAEDGLLLARSGKFFKGPKQILERQTGVMASTGKGVKATVTTVDLWLDGDTAYETGKYSYKFQEKGQPVTEEGRYVTVWRRQSDGSWKIVLDMGVPKD